MIKFFLVVSVILSMLLCGAARAEDTPVYAEVSSVEGIRAAIAQMRPSTGGAIYLKPGTYLVKEPILINGTSHVSIFGAGMDKTIVKKEGDGNAIVFKGPCNLCSVRNLSVVGDPKAKSGSGIVFPETEWSGLSTMDNLTIRDFPENGVYLAGKDATPESCITVSNCLLKNNRKAQIFSNASNDFYYIDNRMVVDDRSLGALGIYLRLSSAGTITGNVFKGCRIGVKMDMGSSMNRIEYNYFDDCTESAIDSGCIAPDDYDVTKVPAEQFYTAWEWDKPHTFRMNTETLIYENYVRASGSNPDFIALNARSSLFFTFYGNKIVADGKIGSVVKAGRNCMTWVISENSLNGEAREAYSLGNLRNPRIAGNTRTTGVSLPKGDACARSDLSERLLKVSAGQDISGKNWFRKVTTTDELTKAIADIPGSGGTIYVTAGNYKINNPLTVENKSNVTIIGSGLGTFLRSLNDGDLLAFKGDCRNCYVGNMSLTPDKADPWHPVDWKTGSAILFQGRGENFTVDYCSINNWPMSCIRVEGDPADPVRNVNVIGNWVIGGKQAQLYMKGCKGFRVSWNQYGYGWADKNPEGTYFDSCSDGLYELNCHWGNRNGINFAQGCEDITIRNNRSEQSKECGLLLGMPGGPPNKHFTIEGNTFHTNPELDPGTCSNVAALNTSDIKFIANQLYTWWEPRRFRHGVELDDTCKNWLFDGNYIRDNNKRAVNFKPGNGHIIKLNYFDPPREKH